MILFPFAFLLKLEDYAEMTVMETQLLFDYECPE